MYIICITHAISAVGYEFCVGTRISIIPEDSVAGDSVAGDSVLGNDCRVDTGTKMCDRNVKLRKGSSKKETKSRNNEESE